MIEIKNHESWDGAEFWNSKCKTDYRTNNVIGYLFLTSACRPCLIKNTWSYWCRTSGTIYCQVILDLSDFSTFLVITGQLCKLSLAKPVTGLCCIVVEICWVSPFLCLFSLYYFRGLFDALLWNSQYGGIGYTGLIPHISSNICYPGDEWMWSSCFSVM